MEVPCEFAIMQLDEISADETFYTCLPDEKFIYNPNQIVKKFVGAHQKDKSNKDVKVIIFNNLGLDFIPSGVMKIFPNLKSFEIAASRLKIIRREDLFDLRHLDFLSFLVDNVPSLPTDLLADIGNVKRIFLFGDLFETLESTLMRTVFERNKFVKVFTQYVYELYTLTYYENNRDNDGMYLRIYMTPRCKLKSVYQPKSLLYLCENAVAKSLDKLDSMEVLEIAHIIRSHRLEDIVELYISRSYPEVDWDEEIFLSPRKIAENIEISLRKRNRKALIRWLIDSFMAIE